MKLVRTCVELGLGVTMSDASRWLGSGRCKGGYALLALLPAASVISQWSAPTAACPVDRAPTDSHSQRPPTQLQRLLPTTIS